MGSIEDFRRLHEHGFFVIPNAWDIGSAVRLQELGFPAIASTSSGFAASLGRSDQETTFDELCEHIAALVAALDIPVSVDAERLFADDVGGVRANAERLHAIGAAGMSIEDYDPRTGRVDPVETAAARVAAAAEVTRATGIVLTGRAENHLYGVGDLDDTIGRLVRYAEAGADVVYAPGLEALDDIGRVVREVGVPVNALLLPGGPAPRRLAEVGVRRASTGGRLAFAAYDAMTALARELLDEGPSA